MKGTQIFVKACGNVSPLPQLLNEEMYVYGLDSVSNEAQRQHSDITQEIYEAPTIVENSRRRRGEKIKSEYLPQPEEKYRRVKEKSIGI